MNKSKLYAGTKLRDIRTRFGLTQKEFAQKLGVSIPYLNQMENNNRPLSAAVILGLAQEFGQDVTELRSGDDERMVSDLREALGDTIFQDTPVGIADLRLIAGNTPSFGHAFLELHRNYRHMQERLAQIDNMLGQSQSTLTPSAWEEVRDFFHYCDNYIDAVDRQAEQFTGPLSPTEIWDKLRSALAERKFDLRIAPQNAIRQVNRQSGHVTLSEDADPATRLFQALVFYALEVHAPLIDATLDLAKFKSTEAHDIARTGLANYFAGAAMMPYRRFAAAAREHRHDLEVLARQFGASIEQVAHRLSTLQREGAKGVPFFFVRVDQAGTITKRHSATRLQFARFGGACALWNVHRAFETPGRFLRQLAETPDGHRYFSLAYDISKPSGRFGAPVRRFAIALGCEISDAPDLVYSDGFDLSNPSLFEPIGISCRICERENCHQRSVPPLERRLVIDPEERGILPYKVTRA